jgi:hypothetical protein
MRLANPVAFAAVLATTLAPNIARSQQTGDTLSLAGRTSLVASLGLARTFDAGVSTTGQTTARATGEVGSLAVSHWVRPQMAVTIAAAVMDANASTGASGTNSEAITPILFGISFSPRALALTPEIRPYVAAAAGPYFRHATSVGSTSVSASSESVPGARFSAGANWFVARHFLLSIEGAYHSVGRFEKTGGDSPRGFGMSLGLGIHWGGRSGN